MGRGEFRIYKRDSEVSFKKEVVGKYKRMKWDILDLSLYLRCILVKHKPRNSLPA